MGTRKQNIIDQSLKIIFKEGLRGFTVDKLSSLINPAKDDETEEFSHDLNQTDAPTTFSLIVFLVLGFAIFYLLFVLHHMRFVLHQYLIFYPHL